MSTMKSGVFYGVGNVKLEEREIPKLENENDVLIKVLRAGICGSDTGAYKHGGLGYGIYKGCIFGHEFVGRVEKKGANVADDIQVGDIVFADPTKSKRGGMFLADVCGGFAEYVVVEDAKKEYNIYPLKSDVDLDVAAIIEPLAVGTQGALCMNPQPDDNVVVLGAGSIGLCAAAGLINHGIKNVIVIDRNDWKLERAQNLGAKTINSKTEDVAERLCEMCGEFTANKMNPQYVDPNLFKIIGEMAAEAGMDPTQRVRAKKPNVQLYVDCAGAKDLLMMSLGMSAEGTKYSIVSVYNENLPISGGMFMGEPTLHGSAGYSKETILEVIDHVENYRTPLKNVITAQFALADFEEAMEKAADKACKNIKVVINCE